MTPPTDDTVSTAERRRLARIVHDDRGNASVEWEDAPPDYERPVLEIADDKAHGLSIQSSDTHNPYERTAAPAREPGNTTKTDLRKLSEWIKLMRELEEKKRNGGGEE